jgi:hypothetical protein
MKNDIYVYIKDGVVSMWIKQYIWHKWMPKTPKPYADAMAKYTKDKKAAYGPTWWGMHDEAPEEKGYQLVGVINESK